MVIPLGVYLVPAIDTDSFSDEPSTKYGDELREQVRSNARVGASYVGCALPSHSSRVQVFPEIRKTGLVNESCWGAGLLCS